MAKNLWLIVLTFFLSACFYVFLLMINPGFELIKNFYELLIGFGVSKNVIYSSLIFGMFLLYFIEFGIFVKILKCDS